MEHILALAIVGLLVVVPPDESVHSPANTLYPDAPGNLLHSTKQAASQAAQAILCDRPPCPPTALDSLAHGVQKTAEGAKEFVTDRIGAAKESVEDAYHHVKASIHDTAQKAKHGAHETLERAKHGMHETAGKAASYIPLTQRPGSHVNDLDPASYVMPGVPQAVENLKRKVDDGRREDSPDSESSPTLESLKTKVEQAMPRKETAPFHIQDKVHDGGEQGTGDLVGDAKKMVGDAYDGKEDCRGKVGAFLHSLKEKLLRTAGRDDTTDGMDLKVRELCSILEDGKRSADGCHVGAQFKGSALHESYDYLRLSALKAIDEAKEVYEKAITGEGGKWKEKYSYLAETAKSAVEGAKEIFDRAAIVPTADYVKEKQQGLGHRTKFIGKHTSAQQAIGQLTSRLKEAAIRIKQRVLATSRSLVRTLYLASFSAAFGVSLWITFFSGYVLSRALPRQQLALVQSKLFPIYLCMVTGCLAVCTIGHILLHPWPSANWLEHLQQWNLTLALALTLCNTLVVEPKVTKVMFEKLKVEKEEGRGQSGDALDDETRIGLASIDTKFRGLHQVASSINLVIMGGLSWHLWYLANRLLV